jgi:regulatory protein YycH of two-component signal transduction system YycFG
MIYKFECNEIKNSTMEVELRSDLSSDHVSFTIEYPKDIPLSIFLSKKDVYHLVGALHLIQKEMK